MSEQQDTSKTFNPLSGKYVKTGGAAHKAFVKKMAELSSVQSQTASSSSSSSSSVSSSLSPSDVSSQIPNESKPVTKQKKRKLSPKEETSERKVTAQVQLLTERKVPAQVKALTELKVPAQLKLLRQMSDEQLDVLYRTLVRQSKRGKKSTSTEKAPSVIKEESEEEFSTSDEDAGDEATPGLSTDMEGIEDQSV